jgi:hypothetical protein
MSLIERQISTLIRPCVWHKGSRRGWILSRVFMYERLFAAPHLMQFGQALPALKQAAMQEVIRCDGWATPSFGDARVLRTSAGLVFVYTVSADAAGKYIHHASVSIPGQVTMRVVGDTFILLWAKLLGVGYERINLQISPATVHHAEFVLDESEHLDFAQRPVETPTVEALKAFQAECLKARLRLAEDIGR